MLFLTLSQATVSQSLSRSLLLILILDGMYTATPPPWVGRSSLCKQNPSTSNILVGMSSESHVSLKEKTVCDELVVCLDSASQIAFIL